MRPSHLLAAAALAAVAPSAAQAQLVAAGTLTCEVAPGMGFVVGSRKDVRCTYRRPDGRRERYAGAITRVGLDIGETQGGRLVWAVRAPDPGLPRGGLAGDYAGAGAQAAVGGGGGANALFGGAGGEIGLEPVSTATVSEFNVAAGIAGLSLRPRPPTPRR